MTSLLGRIFGRPALNGARSAYAEAMHVSNDLLYKMSLYSRSTDAARGIMADIWAQNHNVPFLTTVYEASQEAKSPLEQRRDDK